MYLVWAEFHVLITLGDACRYGGYWTGWLAAKRSWCQERIGRGAGNCMGERHFSYRLLGPMSNPEKQQACTPNHSDPLEPPTLITTALSTLQKDCAKGIQRME